MSMTKRDFETVARVLRVNREYAKVEPSALDSVEDVARDLATAFVSANPRFDRTRFLAACETPERRDH